MIREELYHRTVGILVDAYFNDTLRHGNCYACAVGNIIAANSKLSFKDDRMNMFGERCRLHWDGFPPYGSPDNVDLWYEAIQGGKVRRDKLTGPKWDQIRVTGYSPQELAAIEYAFECANRGDSGEDWMFNGLMAVIEVLDQIHENTDTIVQQQSKARFLKNA